jgi:ribosomal protein S18 acetylase RimI-like enzyme
VAEADRPVIRQAKDADIPAVLDIWAASEARGSPTDTAADVAALQRSSAGGLLVAEAGGALAGTVIWGFDGWRGSLYRLAVRPALRRRGIATTLVRDAEQRLRAAGARRITALVERDHHWATAFWSAAGYELDEGMARYFLNL